MHNEPRVDAFAEDSVENLGAPESLDAETQESPKPDASRADIESRVEARIRDSEERLARQFASMLERVNQSNRDATKARVEQVVQRMNDQPHKRPIPAQDDLRVWESRKRDILDALDLTGREPEWDAVMSRWRTPRDQEDAAAQFRSLAKELRKRVDARVNRSPQTPLSKGETEGRIQPPVMETGGTGTSAPTDAENELAQLIEKGPPAHPKRFRAWEKRIDELSKHLGW